MSARFSDFGSGKTDPTDPHALTVASSYGRLLCKRRHADGHVDDYDSAKNFDFTTDLVFCITELSGLLTRLSTCRYACILRGRVLDPSRSKHVRRLIHDDGSDVATLADAGRSWLALDLDGLPMPTGMDPHDLEACGNVARGILPPAFHAAACIVGATASHLFKPGMRLRLWFMLSRPLTSDELKQWLSDVPADQSLFNPAQIIYTAAPIFVGMPDPLPSRLVMLPGHERVAVPPAVEWPKGAVASPITAPRYVDDARAQGGRYAQAALTRATRAIVGAGEGNRHRTAVTKAWSLAHLVAEGRLTAGDMIRVIEGSLRLAGKPSGEGEKIALWALGRLVGSAR